MTELFVDTQFVDTKNTFRGLTQINDIWKASAGKDGS